MFTPTAKQYLYNREEIEKFLHVKFLEEDNKFVRYYETESGISGIRQVDIVYEFKKIGQHLCFYGVKPQRASRKLGYNVEREFEKFANKRFEQLFIGCRVNMFIDHTFHMYAFNRAFAFSTSYIEHDFLKDAELILSLSSDDTTEFDSDIYDSYARDVQVFYCPNRKGLFYLYDELINLTKDFKTENLESLLTPNSDVFDNYSFDNKCEFYSNENGVFIFYPYDFERYQQFNFFSFSSSYRSRVMYAKLTPRDFFDSSSLSFLDGIEKCKTLIPLSRDYSDKGIILPSENYIDEIDKGNLPSSFFGLKFHSDKVFQRFSEEFNEGNIVSYIYDENSYFGEVFGILPNNQLLIRKYGIFHECVVVNSNMVKLIDDPFVSVDSLQYALFPFGEHITHGKLIEENSTHYRFLINWGEKFVAKIGRYYFVESIYYQNVSDELETKFGKFPIDKMIVTIKKDKFVDSVEYKFFTEIESKTIDDLMKEGFTKNDILYPFFEIINKLNIQFHTVNLFLHCNIKLYGFEETLKKLFNDIPKYSQNHYDTSRIINNSLTNLKKLAVISS